MAAIKQKPEFTLENAAWPALWIDSTGTIRCANQAALNTFGAAVEGDSSTLGAIWSAENTQTPETFLAHWERSPVKLASLGFRLKGGRSGMFPTYICSEVREGQRYFLLQFFPDTPAVSARAKPAESSQPAMDSGLAQKQKLDCALQLIRTVVLDFNNALTTILGHTSLVLGKMESDHPWRTSLVEVEKSAEKAAEIANDLAAFSRQDKDIHAATAGNLNDLLRRSVELFQPPRSPLLRWNLQLESRLCSANFDEAKMQQAFVKILENAVQAVDERGSITVQTSNLDIRESWRDGTALVAPGHYVCVEITDNGSGIPSEIMPRIFEPFFTTKNGHRGLGLAWVYGIVTNHGGNVAVVSQPEHGTTVRVYLPALKRIIKNKSFNHEELSGIETILFVDDDDLVLTMGQTVLSTFGYNVLVANNGQEAINIVAQAQESIDLVITDLVMPNMSGRELIDRLKQLAPGLRVICSSGFARPNNPEEDDLYLKKPFTSQELLQKVKHVLSN
jgi:two-component system, cell cycle sensor histidine kinase and response regulator CckA